MLKEKLWHKKNTENLLIRVRGTLLWQSFKNKVYLCNEAFVKEHIDSITNRDIELSEIPKSQRKAKPKVIEYYLKQANNRDDAILRAWNSGGYTQKSIADYFSIHYSRVSKIINKARIKTPYF